MFERTKAVFGSLEIRLLLPLSITVGAVLAVHALLSYRTTHEHLVQFVHGEADRVSGLIRRATHDGMMLNRFDDVQATIEGLAEEPEVAAIRVLDKRGNIVLSDRRAEIGGRIEADSETCFGCHAEGTEKSTASLQQCCLVNAGVGAEVLHHLVVIENEPECAAAPCHFHPPEQRAIGVLDVETSMAPFDAAIGAAQTQLVWTTIVLILVSGGFAALFVRRVIHRPVRELYEGTQRIAGGDLDTRIEVRGEHRLAQLADAFNDMVGDLRTARQEVDDWSQKLEEKVVEKTEELQNAQHQVLHMERMASLGKLSATVAHELNNPISGVLTYARLVRRELGEQALDADVREELERYLSLVEQECSRCGEIVHNMLTFARRTGAEMAPIDVKDIVERSIMLVRHHIEISNIRLHTELSDEAGTIVADAGQIQQALVALLVNAAEAVQPTDGEVAELEVSLRGTAADVGLEIRDTGSGIEPEVLPHIFEPFFSTKGDESGVGLGLAVVYGIVNRHGGTIDVDSEPGRGTTFRLRLPRQPSPEKADPDPSARAALAE